MRSLVLLIALIVSGSAQAEIVCGPYLQMPVTTSMGVAWETEHPSDGAIQYGKANGPPLGSVKAAGNRTMHYAVLEGLQPATEYWYQVTSDGDTSEEWTFRTAPEKDQDVETRIVFWSDIQHGYDVVLPDGSFKDGTSANWIRAGEITRGNVEEMMRFKPHLQFAPGDIADRGNDANEWRHLFNVLKPLCATAPLMGVTGNHDVLYDDAKLWRAYFHLPENAPDDKLKEIAYTFDYGNMHFLSLPYYPTWQRRLPWIKDTVTAARASGATWVFAGAHEVYEGGGVNDRYIDLGLDFFCGHSHSYHRTHPLIRSPGTENCQIAEQVMTREPWPDLPNHTKDWPFIEKNRRVIRVAGDAWEGEDELSANVSVKDGHFVFKAGMDDASLPQADRFWEGSTLNYLIVTKP